MSQVTHTDSGASDKIKEELLKQNGAIESLRPSSTLFTSTEIPLHVDLIVEFGAEKFKELVKKAVFEILASKYPAMDVPFTFRELKITITGSSIIGGIHFSFLGIGCWYRDIFLQSFVYFICNFYIFYVMI